MLFCVLKCMQIYRGLAYRGKYSYISTIKRYLPVLGRYRNFLSIFFTICSHSNSRNIPIPYCAARPLTSILLFSSPRYLPLRPTESSEIADKCDPTMQKEREDTMWFYTFCVHLRKVDAILCNTVLLNPFFKQMPHPRGRHIQIDGLTISDG